MTRLHEPSTDEPLIVVLIDELAALTGYVGDRETKRRIANALGLLLSQGRAVGVVVVAAVQDPRKDTIPARDLFPIRIALRLTEAEQVNLVLGHGARDRGARCDEIPAVTARGRLRPGRRGRRTGPGPVRPHHRRPHRRPGQPAPPPLRLVDGDEMTVTSLTGGGGMTRRAAVQPPSAAESSRADAGGGAGRAARPDRPGWASRGGVRVSQSVDPDWWFAPAGDELQTVARGVCESCPVRRSCLAYALATGEPDGIWGGFDESERAGMRLALAEGTRVAGDPRPGHPDGGGLMSLAVLASITTDMAREMAVNAGVCVRPMMRRVSTATPAPSHGCRSPAARPGKRSAHPAPAKPGCCGCSNAPKAGTATPNPTTPGQPTDGRRPGRDDDQDDDESSEGSRRVRSTRRRQDAPDLPRVPMENRTVGRTFAAADGQEYRPSMFLTLTLPSYGPVRTGTGRTGRPGDL